MNLSDVEWVITSPVRLRVLPDGAVQVTEDPAEPSGTARRCELRLTDEGQILFDGEFVDVSDDFPVFLGLLDEAADGQTYSAPYSDEPRPFYPETAENTAPWRD